MKFTLERLPLATRHFQYEKQRVEVLRSSLGQVDLAGGLNPYHGFRHDQPIHLPSRSFKLSVGGRRNSGAPAPVSEDQTRHLYDWVAFVRCCGTDTLSARTSIKSRPGRFICVTKRGGSPSLTNTDFPP